MAPRDRQPLSRVKVLDAAVALADLEGADSVSMRRLADELGVVPMALYKHVADKDDLLDGMVDTVIGEFQPSRHSSGEDWRSAVRRTILSARAVILRHPWARRAIETRTVRTPAVLGHMEAVTQMLLRGGLSADLTHHAMHALGNRIWGFSPELFNDPYGPSTPARARTSPAPDPGDYPGILAVTADATARRPGATGCDEEFEFRFALDLLLDALARLQESGWTSTSRP
jgi:AcrR family transcriptional regulator